MRRILYFSRLYSPHDYRFLQALSDGGDQAYVMHLEARPHPLEDRPVPPSVEQIHWRGGAGTFTYRQFLPLRADFARVVRALHPDFILAGPLQTCAFIAASLNLPNLVSMSWGYDLLVDAPRNVWTRGITRFTLQRSAALLGDCETIRRLAISYGMPANKIVTFPWGVDLEHFSPSPNAATADGKMVFLSTRSWEPIYGVDVIAQAFARVAQKYPHITLVMLGNGSLSGELRRIFASQGVSERVSFPGQIGYQQLPRYYRMANIYVSASHSDGTSISLLEAMACGCPVIVSDIPGNREWITAGEQGWLFPDGDVTALAQVMEQAILDPHQLRRMGAAARLRVEQRANWRENFPRIYQAFELVAHGN